VPFLNRKLSRALGAITAALGGALLLIDLLLDPLGVGEPGFGENQTLLATIAVLIMMAGAGLVVLHHESALWHKVKQLSGRLNLSRRLLTFVVLPVASVVIALSCAEVALRILYLFQPPQLTLDEKLGWRPTAGFHSRSVKRDARGHQYQVAATTDEHGFRLSAGSQPAPRLLVVGDSFTHALEVSDDDTYFAHIARLTDWQVHAYGASGYSTLQEAMVIAELSRQLQPDIVLWQWCGNDIFNTTPELERASVVYNVWQRRPYPDGAGGVFYELPSEHPRLQYLAYRCSKLATLVLGRYHLLRIANDPDAGDFLREVEQAGRQHELFHQAAALAEETVAELARQLRPTPLVAFTADSSQPASQVFAELAHRQGLLYVPQLAAELALADDHDQLSVYSEDRGHWSPRGHELAAQILLPVLESALESKSP
jgi:lysophospholipase L1-like esterase